MSACPDALELRAFAEDGEDVALAEHVRACVACQDLVLQARKEELLLRGALPVDVPGDVLTRTLAAVDREASGREAGGEPSSAQRKRRRRRRVRRGQGAWLPLTALAAVGLLLILAQLQARRFDPAPPDALPSDRTLAGRDRDRVPVDAQPADAQPEDAQPEDAQPEDAQPEDAQPDDAQPAAPPPADDPAHSAAAVAVARLSAGELVVPGGSLASGDTLPPGQSIRVGPRPATVRCEGAAALCLAPRSRFSVSLEGGRRVLRLEKGAVFARTTGSKPYAVATVDGLATPLGTRFLVERKSRTRVRTFEGLVRLEVANTGAAVDVRAGFEAVAVVGAPPASAQPSRKRSPRWLPSALQPPVALRFKPTRAFDFEAGAEGFQQGDARRGGARGSKGCLQAVPRADTYAVFVEIEDERGVVTVSPDLWIEVACWSDRPTNVVLQLWSAGARENLSLFVEVPGQEWVTIAAPLREFTDPAGKPRPTPVRSGDLGTCFDVFAGKAGEPLVLLVDDVRFFLQSR